MTGLDLDVDDDLRRRVLEQMCKDRSEEFVCSVTGASPSTVAAIAAEAGWPDKDKARQAWLHLQRTHEANTDRPAGGIPVPRPRPSATFASSAPLPASFYEPKVAPDLEPVAEVSDPAPPAAPVSEPVAPAFVDPDSITAEDWQAAHDKHRVTTGCTCGPDGCDHEPWCQSCADAGGQGWAIAWPCDGVLEALGLLSGDTYLAVDIRLWDEWIATTRETVLPDPLDGSRKITRTLILAHAAPNVVASVRAAKIDPDRVADLIRTVMPRHRASTCPECQAILG